MGSAKSGVRIQTRQQGLEELLTPFRGKVLELLEDLRGTGHDPVVWETLRSRARAKELHRAGTGSTNSLHIYAAAVDIICGRHKWGCYSAGCAFFDDLGRFAEARQLYWGGAWKSRDCPHVQAVPVAQQRRFRASRDRTAFLLRLYSSDGEVSAKVL